MTCFSRTFFILMIDALPIHQIYRLWDYLLINKREIILFVAFGILYQFRQKILSLDFNQNMVWISSLTALNVEQCITDAIIFSKATPPSLYDLNTPEDHFQNSVLGSLSVPDFIEMRHYSLLIDSRPYFSEDHLIGSIKYPKSISGLKELMLQYNRFFLVIAYQGNHPSEVR